VQLASIWIVVIAEDHLIKYCLKGFTFSHLLLIKICLFKYWLAYQVFLIFYCEFFCI